MKQFVNKLRPYAQLITVFILIFIQYPAGVSIGQIVFHQNLSESISPSLLILWGAVRLLIVLPMIFSLLELLGQNHQDIYLKFGDGKKVVAITFWGTFIFTILGVILYPYFLIESSLTIATFISYLPIFLIYSVSNAFAEEVFFRGASLSFLENKTNFWVANIIQSIFFGLIHIINPMSISIISFVVLTFILGLLWGYITKKSGSLIPAITLHVIADVFVAISLF